MATISRRLFSGAALRVSRQVITILVALFVMPFVVHSLGDRMYGLWALLATFLGYYGLLDLGFDSAVQRHVAGAIGRDDMLESNRIISTAFVLLCVLGLLVLVITASGATMAPMFFQDPQEVVLFQQVLVLLGINVAVGFPLKVFGAVLASQLRFDIITTVGTITFLLRTALVVLVLKLGYNLLAMVCVTVLAGILDKILTVYFARKNLRSLKLNLKLTSLDTARTLFSYSFFTFIFRVANTFRFKIDGIVIASFITLAAVTHYRVAGIIITHYLSFIAACMGVLMPAFSQMYEADDRDRMKKLFYFSTKISVYLSSFITFGLILWGKPFIHRWMGEQYLDAYPCLVALAIGCMFVKWQAPSVNLLLGTSKHKFLAISNAIEGIAILALSIILIRYFGIFGVALGTLVPMTLMKLIFQPIYVCRLCDLDYWDYIRRLGRSLLGVGMGITLPLLISVRFAAPNYGILFVLGTASLCFYGAVAWFWEFNPSEKKMLLQAIMPRVATK
ncbi:MAG: oligosaccharide flippase family protein [Pseudomonadota bacterium]